MGSINTEEAARRLARVILSDIELYNRERPKQGETLEGQIEEGRRLFASRVTPDLLPLFDLVVSDRARGSVSSPAPAEPPSTGASTAAVSPDDASPASNPTIQDPPTPAPSIAAPSLEDPPTPAPVVAAPPPLVEQPAPTAAAVSPDDASPASNPTIQDLPTPAPAPSIAAPSLEDQTTPTPAPAPSIAAPSLEDPPTPAPVVVAPPPVQQPAPTARVPTTPRAPETPAVPAQARPAAPPAHEIPVPVLTARFSIPKLLAIVCVVAAAGAVLYYVLP